MLYCKSCKIQIDGVCEHCPLCGSTLFGTAEERRCYPVIPPNRTNKLIQIISIAAISAAIISVAINLLIPTKVWWSLFTVLGLGCGWIWVVVGIIKKAKLLNNIVWQCVIISALAFLWDGLTGWHKWSIDFVFPSICIGAMLAVIILSRVLRMPDKEYLINLIVCALMGIIPLIFLLTGMLKIIIPSVICIAVSLIVIFIQLIFNWKAMYREISKKLHL